MAENKAPLMVAGPQISVSFLKLIGAPRYCKALTFEIEVGGLLKCSAIDLETPKGGWGPQSGRPVQWTVQLPPSSLFYKILTGDEQ